MPEITIRADLNPAEELFQILEDLEEIKYSENAASIEDITRLVTKARNLAQKVGRQTIKEWRRFYSPPKLSHPYQHYPQSMIDKYTELLARRRGHERATYQAYVELMKLYPHDLSDDKFESFLRSYTERIRSHRIKKSPTKK
jgi:hypothetical protein